MSSTSSPPDASNVVHGVFPTQALRVGDGRRFTPERLPEEEPRGVGEGGAASAENSGERRDTPEPPGEEAQACFAFIAGDDKRLSGEHSQAPTPAADGLPGTGQATVGEAMAAPPLDALASDPREGDGRATADGAGELATPPEESTLDTAGAEPYAHGARMDEAAGEAGATHSGEELAGEELAGEELAGEELAGKAGAHAVDPREVDPAEIDPREVAPHEEASHDGAAIPGEKDFEIGLREEADELAAQEVGRQEGDADHASREKAAYEDAEVIAAGPIAAPIAPVTFPTLARASLARVPHAAAPTPGAPRPLTRALDTAARLAADANAAAAALDSLKRLLQQGLPASGQAATPRAAPAAEHRPQRRPAQLPPRPPPPPPPERPTASASLAAVHPAPLPPADRARFDVRGFFAGVALSCAIGIVLYLFMTAG